MGDLDSPLFCSVCDDCKLRQEIKLTRQYRWHTNILCTAVHSVLTISWLIVELDYLRRGASARNVSFRISLRWPQFTLSAQLIKPNYLVILSPTLHHSFFRNLPPLSLNYLNYTVDTQTMQTHPTSRLSQSCLGFVRVDALINRQHFRLRSFASLCSISLPSLKRKAPSIVFWFLKRIRERSRRLNDLLLSYVQEKTVKPAIGLKRAIREQDIACLMQPNTAGDILLQLLPTNN